MMRKQLIFDKKNKSKQLNLRVSPDENKAIYQLSKKYGFSKSEFIRKAVNEYVSNHYSDCCKTIVKA